jgi:spore coat polysaccharide biosynthesis protein SpsF
MDIVENNIVAVIAARMNSSRFYGKSIALLQNIPSLQHIVDRLISIKCIDEIVIATTDSKHDDLIRAFAKEKTTKCFSGSEEDVLDRTVRAAQSVKANHVVIINGDSPIIDPNIVELIIKQYFDANADYASNTWQESWPIGTEAEITSFSILDDINRNSNDPAHHEHVTLAIHENREKYKMLDIVAPPNQFFPELRLTLDTRDDYQLISEIYDALFPINSLFGIDEIIQYVKSNPELLNINASSIQKDVR